MRKLLAFAFVLGLLVTGQSVYAQTTINATYLGAAISDTSATTLINLNSIGSGSTAVVAGNLLMVDGEVMRVKVTPTSASSVSVQRHYMSTPGQTHNTGAFVYYGPSQAFVSGKIGDQFLTGACVASQQLYLPLIDTVNNWIGDCPSEGVWVWYQINPPQAFTQNRHAVVDANYTAKITDTIIAYTSFTTNRTVTLPSANGLAGKTYIIKNETGSIHNIIISGTVDGASNPNGVTTGYGVYRIYSDGANWFTW